MYVTTEVWAVINSLSLVTCARHNASSRRKRRDAKPRFSRVDWEAAEDARLASRQGVANLIHSPRAREQFMRDDVSVSSALSRQTTAYGGQTKTEPVPHPDAAERHRFRYHHSHPIPLHERRTRSVPSRRSPPLGDVGVYSDSVNRNDFVPSFGPPFDPPPSPSRSENHVPLKRATRVLMRAWRPQPQGSTASQWSASAKVESQDSQRLGSQISTPRGSPSKMEKLLNSLKTTVDAFEVQRQAAEDQRQADEVKRQAAEAVAAQRPAPRRLEEPDPKPDRRARALDGAVGQARRPGSPYFFLKRINSVCAGGGLCTTPYMRDART